jgi:hypothetical protein
MEWPGNYFYSEEGPHARAGAGAVAERQSHPPEPVQQQHRARRWRGPKQRPSQQLHSAVRRFPSVFRFHNAIIFLVAALLSARPPVHVVCAFFSRSFRFLNVFRTISALCLHPHVRRGLHLAGNAVMVDCNGFVIPRVSSQSQAVVRDPRVTMDMDVGLGTSTLLEWGRRAHASAQAVRQADSRSLTADWNPDLQKNSPQKPPTACTPAQADAIAAQADRRIIRTKP